MYITYVIGKGFDIAKGFDTSYEAYYNYLNNNKSKYPYIDDIIESINKYKSNIGDINWSDFEEGLLEYISKNNKNISINDCKKKISACIKALNDFLRNIDSELESKNTPVGISNEIYTPFFFCEVENKKIIVKKGNYGSKNNISVVSLNYTRICDRYFGTYPYRLISLHGRVDLTPIVLGIDNQNQFDLERIDKKYTDELSEYICKNIVVKNHLSETNDEFKTILSLTELFVIYGTSLGRTDESLWKKIGQAIVNNDAYVIVSCYKNYINPSNTVEYVDFVTEKRKHLCNIFGIDYMKYANNIFLVDSNKILKGNFENKLPPMQKIPMYNM